MTQAAGHRGLVAAPDRRRRWLAAHLGVAGDPLAADADRVILDLIAPLAEKALAEGHIQRFFFLRYHDGTPHVRFRLLGRNDRLEAEIRPRIEAWSAAGSIASLAWIAYEPETERYGGPSGMRLAEHFFHHSSLAAIALLRRAAAGGRAALLGKGLLAAVVLLHTMTGSRPLATEICRRSYGSTVDGPEESGLPWRQFEQSLSRQTATLTGYLESAWRRLARGVALTPELDAYRRALVPLASRLRRLHGGAKIFAGSPPAPAIEDCLHCLVPSYLHLMNNRLGIPRSEEVYLAGLISRAAERPAGGGGPSA
jgi:thiopeptide-type bacteriocin biosynthesis protein